MKNIKSKNGYALTLFVILLPLFLSIFLGFMFFSGIILEFTKSDSDCFKKQLELQLYAQSQAQKLLSWNTKSTLYRTQKAKAQRKWNEAFYSNDRLGMDLAEKKLSKIQLQQITLDINQKELLTETKNIIHQKSENINRDLSSSKYPFLNSLNPWITYNSQSKILEIPIFDLTAQDSDLAPIYERSLDFSTRQKLALEWHIEFQVQPILGDFEKFKTHFNRICATTLIEKDKKWIPIIL
ncbi:MAG TPA: hypothetical protein PLJ21_01995 [Pseudobdellovibrionaceae bacterium]|nr:hypothetical protein [Pseudobdellovibrionaceae bacterium]